MKKFIVSIVFVIAGIHLNAQMLPAPEGLLCDLLREPSSAVITNKTPAFSWIFPQTGLKQAAYRILVASSPFLLAEGKADCWDSKTVRDQQSINILYKGNELEGNSVYWWAVKVESENGMESQYSLPQQFTTGNFDRSGLDYPGQSKWIELSPNNWVSEDKQRALATVRDYLEGRRAEYELEHRLQHKDGSYRWILARGAVVRDQDGQPYRMAGSHLDITERRRADQTLRHQEAQLIAAEEIQSHLLPQSPPEVAGLQIAGKCFPAEFAAGDSFEHIIGYWRRDQNPISNHEDILSAAF